MTLDQTFVAENEDDLVDPEVAPAFDEERSKLEVEWDELNSECADAVPVVQGSVDEMMDLASDLIDLGVDLNRVVRGLNDIAGKMVGNIESATDAARELLKFSGQLNAIRSDSTETARNLMRVVNDLVHES